MLQISLITKQQDLEAVEQALLDSGARSVTLQNAAEAPIMEPFPGQTPLWPIINVGALFPADANAAEICARLDVVLGPDISLSFHTLADRDWVRITRADFKPIRFGQKLWICPSWEQVSDPNAVVISLDPGLAFGTGTHPTTALCLQWLDAHPPRDLAVIDYGCGSGVLAIAALKLGARHVWAVDIDPQARLSTQQNAAKNGIGKQQIDIVAPHKLPRLQSELIIANILSGPLIDLCPSLSQRLTPAGKIILSGILIEQTESVTAHYSSYCIMGPARLKDGWALLEGHRIKGT
ncbi:MAG: 50S ribosomal protein L11 methyltransferase [Pseudomonadota bacterium]